MSSRPAGLSLLRVHPLGWIAPLLMCAIIAHAGDAHGSARPAGRPDYLETGGLTFEDRVWAQTQIERVYYNHRIWPKENPGPKPPFEQALPRKLIEQKAVDPGLMSAALRARWSIHVTPAMLQAELDRMMRESRDPARLRELFTALGDDPRLIAETLAREGVARQLLQAHYAHDPGLHAVARARVARAAAQSQAGVSWSSLDGQYSRTEYRVADPTDALRAPDATSLTVTREEFNNLHALASHPASLVPKESGGGWEWSRIVSEARGRLVVERVFLPKRSFDDWWNEERTRYTPIQAPVVESADAGYIFPEHPAMVNAVCDTWDNRINNYSPEARGLHAMVWTGSEMIIAGGDRMNGTAGYRVVYGGDRYDPATDSWRRIPAITYVGGPGGPLSGFWTGSEVIWDGDPNYFRYNPATDSLVVMPSLTARGGESVVWTGSELIRWGGKQSSTFMNDGQRYSPSSNSWTLIAPNASAPVGRANHGAVWTGSRMIVWGGYSVDPFFGTTVYYHDGSSFNPADGQWQTLTDTTGTPSARTDPRMLWTGTEVLVWAGKPNGGSATNTGAKYHPATGLWTPIVLDSNAPPSRDGAAAIWTGSEMLVWGGAEPGFTYSNGGGRYNPSSNSWMASNISVNPLSPRVAPAVWTGSEMIVWGGYGYNGSFFFPIGTGGRYNPQSDTWVTTALQSGVPAGRRNQAAVWTGSELLIWGGNTAPSESLSSGGRYDPALNRWATISTGAGTPSPRLHHTAIWTGSEMIIWGGQSSAGGATFFNSGARYNPGADAWMPTSITPGTPTPRFYHTTVWTGNEMVVWGGYDGGATANGAHYNPATNAWTATGSSPNLPSPRWSHLSVWTGSEMIVWGGYDGSPLNTGGRYNPASRQWSAMSTGTGVPSPRFWHSMVWTDNQLIIWGGNLAGGYTNTGGRYFPATNSWLPTSTGVNVPTLRDNPEAVWTGSEMIVWGGYSNGYLNTGARYRPDQDSWSPTSLSASVPSARALHSMIWTPLGMFVWAGEGPGPTGLSSGGLYSPGTPGTVGNGVRCLRSTTFDLSWNPAAGAASYNVRRCQAGAGFCMPTSIIASPATTAYSEPLDANSYYYAVEAVNNCGVMP